MIGNVRLACITRATILMTVAATFAGAAGAATT